VHPLACNWYYCAQFIAKPKAACALRFSWAATSSNLGLSANLASSVKPEVHNVSLRHQNRIEPRPYVTCTRNLVKIGRVIPKICSQTDKHTHTDRQTRSSQYSAPLSGRTNQSWRICVARRRNTWALDVRLRRSPVRSPAVRLSGNNIEQVVQIRVPLSPSIINWHQSMWLGSRVDLSAVGAGFKSQPRRCRVTVLGKLFTHIVPLFTKQRNW